MPSYTAPDFSEDLFSIVLESCTPSRVRVESITQLALSHPPRAVDAWAALRKALVRQEDLESDKNRALWYVIDSLMKHAPHVFVPLIVPRLHDYVLQHMPWDIIRKKNSSAGDGLWCDAMIRTWEGLLPPNVFNGIRSFVIQLRSEKEMASAMGNSGDGHDDGEGIADSPATPEELQRLRESWETIRSLAAEGAGGHDDESTEPAAMVAAVVNPQTEGRLKADGRDGNGDAHNDSESDGEYVPELLPGAQRRELPPLFGVGEAKPRRAARRRSREEE